jgi:hypothetical protein
MPKSSPAKLAYQLAYNKTPKQKIAQVERRRAERAAVRDGSSPIGDGKDLSHIVAADNGGRATKKNLKLQDASKNRDWRKGQKGYKVPTDK